MGEISDIENLFDNTPTSNEALKAVKALIRQKAIARVECNFLTHALSSNDWNVTRAAKAVGMQRPNFQNMMKKHGITLPRHQLKRFSYTVYNFTYIPLTICSRPATHAAWPSSLCRSPRRQVY